MNENPDTPNNSITAIYSEKIRTLRTRSCEMEIPERENDVQILHTLLGIELKVGRRRFSCPDLATARYMRVFARLGCRSFAIPYDITKISTLADELETVWQRTHLRLTTDAGKTDALLKRERSRTIREIRKAIDEIGPGDRMPEFKQSTKQRKG